MGAKSEDWTLYQLLVSDKNLRCYSSTVPFFLHILNKKSKCLLLSTNSIFIPIQDVQLWIVAVKIHTQVGDESDPIKDAETG